MAIDCSKALDTTFSLVIRQKLGRSSRKGHKAAEAGGVTQRGGSRRGVDSRGRNGPCSLQGHTPCVAGRSINGGPGGPRSPQPAARVARRVSPRGVVRTRCPKRGTVRGHGWNRGGTWSESISNEGEKGLSGQDRAEVTWGERRRRMVTRGRSAAVARPSYG